MVLDRADPNAKALAANRVVEAIGDQEFVATTTRRVVEQFFYNAEKQTLDVTKTMAAGIAAGAPSFGAQHTVQRTTHGTETVRYGILGAYL